MKKALVTIAVVAVLMVLSGVLGWHVSCNSRGGTAVRDTLRTVVTDTIPYYEPVANDSVVVRYVTKVLPLAGKYRCDSIDNRCDSIDRCDRCDRCDRGDSVAVEVPITQKKYETEGYRAYVSGFEPRLDSIFVFQKTLTERIVHAGEPPGARRPRLGVGVITGVGYGMMNKKPDVFIGLGLYFSL